jgi:hypothetical protein
MPIRESRVKGNRLSSYKVVASASFWKQYWKSYASREGYNLAEQGEFGLF